IKPSIGSRIIAGGRKPVGMYELRLIASQQVVVDQVQHHLEDAAQLAVSDSVRLVGRLMVRRDGDPVLLFQIDASMRLPVPSSARTTQATATMTASAG
ncbi:MAG: hypothetical protein O7F56_05570, partial [Acidobacteria bacterium]|nr:hypothetical protein [Acidobacteriota bacterium]